MKSKTSVEITDEAISHAMDEGTEDALAFIDQLSVIPSLSKANLVKKDLTSGTVTIVNFDYNGWRGDWASDDNEVDENDIVTVSELEDISNGILIGAAEGNVEEDFATNLCGVLSELVVQGTI